MKCKNCGYEIEKPNQRTCPCCGQSLTSAPDVTPPPTSSMDIDTPLQVPKHECPSCHTFVSVGTNFCPNCGHNMQEEEVSTPPPYEEPEPVLEPVPEPELQPVSQPVYKPEPQPTYDPEPAYTPDPEPSWEPEPAPQPKYERRRKAGSAHPKRMSEIDYNNSALADESDDIAGYSPIPDDNGWSGAQIVPDGSEPQPTSSSSSSTLIMIGIAIGSLLLGALLYLVI